MLGLISPRLKTRQEVDAAEKHSSRWRKEAVTKGEQTLVTVAGIEAKVGATHFALSLAVKASQQDINCALILPAKSFEALRHYYVMSVREEVQGEQKETRQFANFAGLNIMAGVLPGDIEGFQLVIWDCGRLAQGQRRFSSGDLCCVVSGGQPWELLPLNALLTELSYEELRNYAICIRGASESDFHHIKQQIANKLPCINILHKADWSDVKLREDLVTILRLVR
jgi:hypothetical protein